MTIETDQIEFDEVYCATHLEFVPGQYVLLAVSDNGRGMDETTKAHIFEPFFTTKAVGEGTGLGLATVYGIVRQNEGFINVYSEPDQGTTFRIYLPAYKTDEAEPDQSKPESTAPAYGHETVLLVEDETAILELGRQMLKSLGYRVLTAAAPGEAMRLAEEYTGQIHLLITDVVMPEMNGRQLAERLQVTYPDLAVLFISGYTANVIAHRGILEAGVHFLQKPFSVKELAAKVRMVLARGTAGGLRKS